MMSPVFSGETSAGQTSCNVVSLGQDSEITGASLSSIVITWLQVSVALLPQASVAVAVHVRVTS